jgi:hypothetical protein
LQNKHPIWPVPCDLSSEIRFCLLWWVFWAPNSAFERTLFLSVGIKGRKFVTNTNQQALRPPAPPQRAPLGLPRPGTRSSSWPYTPEICFHGTAAWWSAPCHCCATVKLLAHPAAILRRFRPPSALSGTLSTHACSVHRRHCPAARLSSTKACEHVLVQCRIQWLHFSDALQAPC